MKLGPIIKFLGAILLILLALASIRWLDRRQPIGPLALTPTPSPSQSVQPITERVPQLSRGTVAVQTFSGSTLVRTAAGTVVTSDGLVVTTTAAAPYGSGSYIYQVMTTGGAIVRAQRAAYDTATGLILLKVQTDEMGIVQFDSGVQLRPGDDITIVGATVAFSDYAPVIVPAWVTHVIRGSAALSVDRTYLPLLHGARLVDHAGRTVGLFRHGATPGVIPAEAVNAFVERYLSSLQSSVQRK